MNKFVKLVFLILIAVNLVLCSWYVLHQDLYFQTDIARDFLLLEELDQKKIVLLGPRSSTGGLFHGPLWTYLNYPAYVIGQGNPIIVGWYWILLIVAFLVMSFVIAKKLFNETTAYLYILLLSIILIFEARALFNPHGAFFLLPAFFFFFIRYIQDSKPRTLFIFLLIAGCIVQFQMAIGIPLLMLATGPIVFRIVKQKHFKHFLAFFILLIPLATFILFDLKHNFIQFHSLLAYVFGNNLDVKTYTNFWGVVVDRFNLMSSFGIGIFKESTTFSSRLVAIFIAFLLASQIRENRYKTIYLSFLYFYVGFYILSIINKSGGMLYHYYMPLYPLVFLIFASFITSKYKKIFLLIYVFALWMNFTSVRTFIASSENFFGKDQNSWKFLNSMAQKVYTGPEKELGYFLYMPDAFAYQPKYAVSYASKHTDKTSFYFQKQPITYLVIAPPPPDKIGMEDSWWRINQVKIDKKPQTTTSFANGYKIERYELSETERQIPFDPAIDTGIHFR